MNNLNNLVPCFAKVCKFPKLGPTDWIPKSPPYVFSSAFGL